jgi:hypothetical protein
MSETKKISNLFGLLKKHHRNTDPGGTGSSARSHSPLPEDSAAHAKTESGALSESPITHRHANIIGGQSGAHAVPYAIPIAPSPPHQGYPQFFEPAQPGDATARVSSASPPTQNLRVVHPKAESSSHSSPPSIRRSVETQGTRSDVRFGPRPMPGRTNLAAGHSIALSRPNVVAISQSVFHHEPPQIPERAQPTVVAHASSSPPPTQNPGLVVTDSITHSIFHAEYTRPWAEVASTRSWRERLRDGAIIVNDFVSIIADATDITKPLKVACDGLNYILKNTRVRSSV